MTNRHYTIISANGSRVVMIDRKISIRTQLMAGLQRFVDWFESGSSEDLLVMGLMFGSFIALYTVGAI